MTKHVLRDLDPFRSLNPETQATKYDQWYCNLWTHPQPRPFPAVIGRYHKRPPARVLVSRFKAEGPRLDPASALLFLPKGCGLWTQSCCDFVPHN